MKTAAASFWIIPHWRTSDPTYNVLWKIYIWKNALRKTLAPLRVIWLEEAHFYHLFNFLLLWAEINWRVKSLDSRLADLDELAQIIFHVMYSDNVGKSF